MRSAQPLLEAAAGSLLLAQNLDLLVTMLRVVKEEKNRSPFILMKGSVLGDVEYGRYECTPILLSTCRAL
jgi:hypothetical protein